MMKSAMVDAIIAMGERNRFSKGIFGWFGMVMTVIAFLFLVFIIVRRLVFGDPVAGWASTICVIIFIGGIQLFCLGVMGQYIAKNYSESKHRTHYIVAETNKEKTDKIR